MIKLLFRKCRERHYELRMIKQTRMEYAAKHVEIKECKYLNLENLNNDVSWEINGVTVV